MTVPSVGPIVAITYKSAMDDPNRIAKSKAAGALFGLTPKKYQSGGLRGPAMRWYAPRFMKPPMFCWRA
jgi:transposase